MNVTHHAPSAALAPFVRTFEIVETGNEEAERTLLPDTTIIVGLRYAGTATLLDLDRNDAALPDGVITGLRATARRMRTSANGGIVLAKFHAMGARSFFDGPLHRLFGGTRPLDAYVDPAEVRVVSERIARAESGLERVAIFERFLLARCTHQAPDRLVSAALRAIHADPGGIRIGALARSLGVSQDALEKRFRRVVGASPKAFAGVVHFRRALDAYPQHQPSLTQLALDAGYCDQSHFNRRFRSATGASPSRVLGSPDYC